MTGQTTLAVLADPHVAAMAMIAKAAARAGLGEEQTEALLEEYAREIPKPEREIVCGNVDKASKLRCTRAPHPDAPGRRENHAAQTRDKQVITWQSQPTLAEQLASEKGSPTCGVKSHVLDSKGLTVVCVRAKHDAKRVHAGELPAGGLITWQ